MKKRLFLLLTSLASLLLAGGAWKLR